MSHKHSETGPRSSIPSEFLSDLLFALGAGIVVALFLWAGSARAHVVRLEELPVGDGQVSSEPSVGQVFACRTYFDRNAGGAHASGDWLGSATFDLTRKPTVDGEVYHLSELSIWVEGSTRRIVGNGLPDHATGTFPIARSDDAFDYDRNPASIRAHRVDLRLPARPEIADEASCVPMGAIGVMTSGAVLFNALDGRGDDALAHEILDRCQGHPQREGVYHYHGKSPCIDDPAAEWDHSGLVGYAFDGFGIFGWRGEDGEVLGTDDLDECHGHVGTIDWHGSSALMYHYHATPDYPYTVGCFRGTPAESAHAVRGRRPDRRGPPGRRGRGPGPGRHGG